MKPIDLLAVIRESDYGPHVGVPDSLLRGYLHTLDADHQLNVVAPNEGTAVAYAIGHFLRVGSPAVVYLQNSGLGNAINPLLSLAHDSVFAVPMLLVIGWRGHPETKDEPQHRAQGAATERMLHAAGIGYLRVNKETAVDEVRRFLATARGTPAPQALLVRSDALAEALPPTSDRAESEGAIDPATVVRACFRASSPGDAIVATTGFTARDVEMIHASEFSRHRRPFLCVGGMGHASSIALGLATGPESASERPHVVCIDGDGSSLMHLGAWPWIASLRPERFLHVVLVNGTHESVGGQPAAARGVDFAAIARAAGYTLVHTATGEHEVDRAVSDALRHRGPAMLVAYTRPRDRSPSPRPSQSPVQMRDAFMGWGQEDLEIS